MTSYIDFPVPVLFQICWNVSNPADLAALASFPRIRDRMKQFIHIYASANTHSFGEFKGFVKRPLSAHPEEFTICLVEYEHDKLQELRDLIKKCNVLQQSRCLIGYNSEGTLDLCIGPDGEKLLENSTIYVAGSKFGVRSGVPLEEIEPDRRLPNRFYEKMNGVNYEGWNKNSGLVVGQGSKTVTIHDLKDTGNLTAGTMLLDKIEIGSLSCARCDMSLLRFLNLNSLGELEMQSLDYHSFITDEYGKGIQSLVPTHSMVTLPSLAFPRLRTMRLYGVNVVKSITLPELESLELHLIPARKSDNPLIAILPTIQNVKAPKCATIRLAVSGPLMPKVKHFEVPQCTDLAVEMNTLGLDVTGCSIQNELFKLVVPQGVANVRFSGVDKRWVDLSSLANKNVVYV